MVTIEGRLVVDDATDKLLTELVGAHARLTRELWRRCIRNGEPFEGKGSFSPVCQEMRLRGWTSSQVRSAFAAAKAADQTAAKTAKWAVGDLQRRLEVAEARLQKAKRSVRMKRRRHGLARRRDRLASRLTRLEAKVASGRASPSWGSRRLFRQQHEVGTDGARHATHQDWLEEWRDRRYGETVFVGHAQMRAGNSDAQITLEPGPRDGVLRLRGYRRGSWTEIPVRGLAHGRKHLLAALVDDPRALERRAEDRKAKGLAPNQRPVAPRVGPVTVRLHKRNGRWYVGCSVARFAAPPITTSRARGAVGIDFNPDHLAISLIAGDGNPVAWRRLDLDLTGTKNQRDNQIGEAVAAATALAVEHQVPIVVERLDFQRKKAEIRHLPKKDRAALSSLAYAQFGDAIRWACIERGLECIEVSPAFTSVLGQANYAGTRGVSVDLAAAAVIARRGLGFREKVRPSVARRGPVRSSFGPDFGGRLEYLRALARILPARPATHGCEWLTRRRAPPDVPGPSGPAVGRQLTASGRSSDRPGVIPVAPALSAAGSPSRDRLRLQGANHA